MAEKKIVRRGTGPFVISGNDLRGGEVVWLAEGDAWAPRFEDAVLLETTEDAAVAMGRATEDRRELHVVDVHVVDVHVVDAQVVDAQVVDAQVGDVALPEGRTVPVTYRERVRAFGPTITVGPQAAAERRP